MKKIRCAGIISAFMFLLVSFSAVSLSAAAVCYSADYRSAYYQYENERVSTLGSFATKFNPGSVNRTHNMKLAAEAIDGVIIRPGEEFSFNETVGPMTRSRGFLLAKIFVRGKEKSGYGGGVCQISSTLFNAAEEAGLTVTERHAHSKKVGYVASGRDASTSYGGIDLKFRNDYDYPVYIEASVVKNTAKVSIVSVFTD